MKTLTEPTEIEFFDLPYDAPLSPIDERLACIAHGYQPTQVEPDDQNFIERDLYLLNPDDHEWRTQKQYFSNLPIYLMKYFANRYKQIFNSKGRSKANTFLREKMEPAAARAKMVLAKYKKLPTTQKVYLLSDDDSDTEQSNFAHPQQSFDFTQADTKRKPPTNKILAELEADEIKQMAFKLSQISAKRYMHIAARSIRETKAELEEQQIKVTEAQLDELGVINGYEKLASFVEEFGIKAPRKRKNQTETTALNDISRMIDEKWWLGRLMKVRKIMREHLAIAMGQVSSKASPYASWDCIREHKEQQKRNWEFIKQSELFDQETGETADLAEMVLRSVSNPAIRRHELMVRCRGCEDIGNELGLQGLFLTLTAPSKYHNSYKKGGFVPHWNGASPRDAQAYLNNVWQRIRAKLGRDGLRWFGVRVAEPHHDGTPHWHLLIWVKPEEKEAVSKIFIDYAVQEDKHELFKGGEFDYSPRCDVGEIDPEKGTATGYIAKYISKNIDGFAMDDEVSDETGQAVKDMAKNVSAWKSRWNIRQFQFFGGAPVTTYRELRRFANQNKKAFMEYLFMQERSDLLTIYSMLQRDLVGPIKPSKLITNQELFKIIGDSYQARSDAKTASVSGTLAAADHGNWQAYIMGQGGPFVRRDDLLIVNSYEVLPFASAHGEDVRKIKGFTTPEETVETRTKVWVIQPKGTVHDEPEAGALALSSSAAAPWSSVNNCTQEQKVQVSDQLRRLFAPYLINGGLPPTIDESAINALLKGSSIRIDEETTIRIRSAEQLPCGGTRPAQLVEEYQPKPNLSWLGEPEPEPVINKPLTEENYQQPDLSHFEYVDDWPLV